MSQENVEIVRRGTDAYNRGELDGLLENWAPDAVVDWSRSRGFDAGVFRGHDAIRAHWQRLLAAFDTVRIAFGGTMRSRRTGSDCSRHSTQFGSSSLTQ